MKERKMNFGPGTASLILVLLVLSMSIMGVLTLISARNAKKLSERSLQVTGIVYNLYDHSERSLAKLDAIVAKCRKNTDTDLTAEAMNTESVVDKPEDEESAPAEVGDAGNEIKIAKTSTDQTGNDFLARVREALPDTMEMTDKGLVSWVEKDKASDYMLECSVQIPVSDQEKQLVWQTHRLSLQMEDVWNW